MTLEEIIALAKQCGLYLDGENQQQPLWVLRNDELEAFFHAAQRMEREGIADDLEHGFVDDEGHHIQYAEAIRNRN